MASEQVLGWLSESLELRRVAGWSASALSYDRFAESVARAGYWTLACQVAPEIEEKRHLAAARVVGAGRYDCEGASWFASPDRRLPTERQLVGALMRAAKRGDTTSIRALSRLMALDDYLAGLRLLGESFPSDEAVLEAAKLAIEAHVAPSLLLRRLASDGRESLAFELIEHSTLGGSEAEIARGLAARGELEAALRLVESMSTSPFSHVPGVLSPVTPRGQAITGIATEWLAKDGPHDGDRFLRLMTPRDRSSRAEIVGAIAQARAKAGDPEALSGIEKLRGMLAFQTQMGAFWGYLNAGHLALALRAQQHADSTQRGFQLGAVAAKHAELGDLETALKITEQLRRPDKDGALGTIVRLLCDQGRFDSAQELIVERSDASSAVYLAWAKAFAGPGDPFLAEPVLTGIDRAVLLEYVALGTKRINPWSPAFP